MTENTTSLPQDLATLAAIYERMAQLGRELREKEKGINKVAQEERTLDLSRERKYAVSKFPT